MEQGARTGQVAVIQIPLAPDSRGGSQLLGQGRNDNSEEQWSTGVALLLTLCTGHDQAVIPKELHLSTVTGEGICQKPRAQPVDSFQKLCPFDCVVCIFEVQLQQHVIWHSVPQPLPDAVHKSFSAPRDTNTHLFRPDFRDSFSLVACNKELACQPTDQLTNCYWPHSPILLTNGNQPSTR
jgi:hypothetical protein